MSQTTYGYRRRFGDLEFVETRDGREYPRLPVQGDFALLIQRDGTDGMLLKHGTAKLVSQYADQLRPRLAMLADLGPEHRVIVETIILQNHLINDQVLAEINAMINTSGLVLKRLETIQSLIADGAATADDMSVADEDGLEREYDNEIDDDPNACSHPRGHQFVNTGTAYGGDDERWGGEDRSYCRHCDADGDS